MRFEPAGYFPTKKRLLALKRNLRNYHGTVGAVALDEDGNLALASPTAESLTVHSRVELLKGNAWTVPTLAGTKLYVRDRKNIMALELK